MQIYKDHMKRRVLKQSQTKERMSRMSYSAFLEALVLSFIKPNTKA